MNPMTCPAWLTVLLTIGAVARLTRLVTADQITHPIRERIVAWRHDDENDWIIYLIHCRWCASIWLAAPVTALVMLWPHNPILVGVLLALTASHATALLAGLEDD